MNILIPILLFAGMGLLAGILLTLASHVFAVQADPRQEQIAEALPGANCGGCGFAGCADYAAAVAAGTAAPNLCKPGGAPVADALGKILGIEVETAESLVMLVHCSGDCKASRKLYSDADMRSCAAAKASYGGSGLCSFGCLGLGDCATVCDDHAISIRNGIAAVDPDRCIACGKCARVCPNGLLSLHPKKSRAAVTCSSQDNGRRTKQACDNGCIACRMCVKKCPQNAISIEQSHAVIDYDACVGCGLCTQVCPTGAVKMLNFSTK